MSELTLTYDICTTTNEASVSGYTGEGDTIKIPSTYSGYPVTSIKASAFQNCTQATSVTFGNNLLQLGNSCFQGCTGLTSIWMPNNIETINNYAFRNCTNLTSVTLSTGLKSMYDEIFSGCTNFTKVNVKDITKFCTISYDYPNSNPLYYAHNLYLNNNLVTNLVMPNTVKSINHYAFYGCTSLISVTFDENLLSIKNEVFENCTNLTTVTTNENLDYIGKYVFYGCTALTTVNWNAKNCSTIYVESSYGGYNYDTLFKNCTNLTSISFGANVEVLPEGFLCNRTWNEIVLPENLTELSTQLCMSATFTKLTLPKTITFNSSAKKVFYEMVVTDIYYPNTIGAWFDIDFSINLPPYNNSSNATLYSYSSSSSTSYSAVTSISLTSTSSWNGKVSNNVFYNYTKLTSLTLKNSTTDIGEKAFYGCTGLTSATIGWVDSSKIWKIGANAFYGCTALTSYSCSTTSYPYSIGSLAFQNTGLTSFSFTSNIVSIGDYAFQNTKFTSIAFGLTYTPVLGNQVFRGCTELVTANLANVKPSEYLFYQDTKLTTVTFTVDLQTIPKYCFKGCTALTTLNYPTTSNVQKVADYAFEGCTSLTSLPIRTSNSLLSIGSYAFNGCTNLTDSLVTGDNCISIGLQAFNSTKLTSIELGPGLTSISGGVFNSCSSLTSVTFGKSITQIGDNAFNNCTALSTVTYAGTETDWNAMTISTTGNDALTSATRAYKNLCKYMKLNGQSVKVDLAEKDGSGNIIIDTYQYKLTEGTNINIANNVISATDTKYTVTLDI